MTGRSNVGKSSLLNALTRQWGVVRTSDKPGLTQVLTSIVLTTSCVGLDMSIKLTLGNICSYTDH